LTVFLVPGIFVGTSIPALAFGTPDSAVFSKYSTDASQSLDVAAGLEAVSVERSSFDASTEEEIAAAELEARYEAYRASASDGKYSTVGGPRAPGDDYPWRGGSGLSPLNYVMGQCVDFVAWRLNGDAGTTRGNYKWVWSNLTPGGGSAYAWANAWRAHGWKTSHVPVTGAVAWWSGHVAYVKSVSGKSVDLEEYNWNGDQSYHTRTIPASEVALFLYPPP
jgi:surface antigen